MNDILRPQTHCEESVTSITLGIIVAVKDESPPAVVLAPAALILEIESVNGG